MLGIGEMAMNDLLSCFLWICKQDTNYCTKHAYVYPCTWCSGATGIPLKRVRNAMKRLASYGYVRIDTDGGYDDWNERIWCLRGYVLTEKGRGTAIWKKYEREEIEYIERSLHGDG